MAEWDFDDLPFLLAHRCEQMEWNGFEAKPCFDCKVDERDILEENFETITALANRDGGSLVIGISQIRRGKWIRDWDRTGLILDESQKEKIKQKLLNFSNSRDPDFSIEDVWFHKLPNGRFIIDIAVPSANPLIKPLKYKNQVFYRYGSSTKIAQEQTIDALRFRRQFFEHLVDLGGSTWIYTIQNHLRNRDWIYSRLKERYTRCTQDISGVIPGKEHITNFTLMSNKSDPFPFVLFPADPSQYENPESVIRRPVRKKFCEIDTRILAMGTDYRRSVQKIVGDSFWNGLCYNQDKIQKFPNGTLSIDISFCSYGDMLATCDALEYELAIRTGEQESSDPLEEQFTELNQRDLVDKMSTNPIIEPLGRAASLSFTAMVVFPMGENSWATLLKERSKTVASDPSRYHLLPSAMYQPIYGDLDFETSLEFNIYREFLEEAFYEKDKKEPRILCPTNREEMTTDWLDSIPVRPDINKIYKDPIVTDLRGGKGKIIFTGLATTLIKLRTEICFVLLIDDKDWWKRHVKQIWITPDEFDNTKGDTERVLATPLDDLYNILDRKKWVPQGLSASILGLKYLREIGVVNSKEN